MEAETSTIQSSDFPFLEEIEQIKEQLIQEIAKKYLKAFQSVFTKCSNTLSDDQRKLVESIAKKFIGRFTGVLSDKMDGVLENSELQEAFYDLYSLNSKVMNFDANTLSVITRVQSVKMTFMERLEMENRKLENTIENEVNGFEMLEPKCIEEKQNLRVVYSDVKNICNNMCRKLEQP